jgi:hypothetical protein
MKTLHLELEKELCIEHKGSKVIGEVKCFSLEREPIEVPAKDGMRMYDAGPEIKVSIILKVK